MPETSVEGGQAESPVPPSFVAFVFPVCKEDVDCRDTGSHTGGGEGWGCMGRHQIKSEIMEGKDYGKVW